MYFFISYSHNDADLIKDIERNFRDANVECFLYERNVRPGERIVESVLEAIEKSTHMLVMISASSLESSWVPYEVGIADGISQVKNRITVIPYVIPYASKDRSRIDKSNLPDFLKNRRCISSFWELNDYIQDEIRQTEAGRAIDEIILGDLFDFFGFSASIKPIDFCKSGYKPENIHCTCVQAHKRKCSPDLRKQYKTIYGDWNEKKINGSIYDHNDLIGLNKYILKRIGEDEDKSLDLQVFVGSYVEHRVAVDLFRGLSSEAKSMVIQDSVGGGNLRGGHSFFGNIIAVSIALITYDNKLVFQRRSKNVSIDPGLIMCGVGEGMKASDLDSSQDTLSGPFRTSIRGLKEEFGVELENPRDCLILNGLCLNREIFEWYILGVFDLRKSQNIWDESALRSNFNSAISKDGFEMSQLFFVPYNPLSVFRFLREHRSEMVNYGIISSIYSMISDPDFSFKELRNSASRAINNI